MKKEKPKNPWKVVRKTTPPPTRWHKDKSKYTRKRKHKKGL